MGRIIFDPKAFAPQYVAPRIQRQERSRLDPFLTPSGLVATAGLVGMLGKLRLPEGLRDAGVDAQAEAMKQAAQARASAKQSLEQQRKTYDKERQEYMAPDREVLTRAADVSAADVETAQSNQIRRARMEANRAFQQGDDAKAREILMQAGDRIGLASMQMTSGERRRRQVQKQRQDTDRLGRMVEPRQTAAEQRTNVRRKDFKGLGQEAMAPGATGVSGDQYAAALNEAVRLAKEEAPTDKGLGQPVGTSFAGDYEFGGIRLEDFKTQDDGTPGPKVKGLTRAQIRDLMIEWKEGGKAKALKAASETGQDVAEINAFEELLHRELRRKAREEQPKFSVDVPMSPLKEDEFLKITGEEAYEAFMKEKRAEDPYYGMRPEDAIIQIYKDASTADTGDKQAAIKKALATYEPRARTFGDLFVDSRQERVMKHLANVEKIFPAVDEPLSELDQARIRKLDAQTRELEKKLRGLGQSQRKGQLKRGLASARKDVEKVIEARNNIGGLQQQIKRLGKFSDEEIASGQKLEVLVGSGKKVLTEKEMELVRRYDRAKDQVDREKAEQLEELRIAGTALELGDNSQAERTLRNILKRNKVKKDVDALADRTARLQEKVEQEAARAGQSG